MKLGFIGAGNMAQAMIGGILAKGIVKKMRLLHQRQLRKQ